MARVFLIFGWCICCAVLAINAAPTEKRSNAEHHDARHEDVPTPDGATSQEGKPDVAIKAIRKRSAAPESNHDDYPDYLLGVKYDEYPMIVPKKRAALLIDRLMVALQKAIEDEEGRGVGVRTKTYSLRSDDGMDLQRRGHQSVSGQKNGRYWRCYFNAVTCF